MSDIISDPRQVDLEEAIARVGTNILKGMDEARRQIDVGRALFMKATGKPAHHFDALSPSERRPYIDQACLPENRTGHDDEF